MRSAVTQFSPINHVDLQVCLFYSIQDHVKCIYRLEYFTSRILNCSITQTVKHCSHFKLNYGVSLGSEMK